MATGLEALGAASAVLSFITFAGKIVSLSYKIYDGGATDEQELEDYSRRMLDASERVRSRNQQIHHGTPAEVKLSEIAGKCVQLAGELQKESQSITKRYRKGKLRQSFLTALRVNAHRTKINELDQALQRYRQVMETELLFSICDKNTAIEKQQSQKFPKLERDIQDLINNLANGQTKLEMLVTEEAEITRQVLSTSLATHIRASDTRAITDNQRQRLLKSLKPEEIRMRYNEVMSPSDASFERVFASYERVCRKDPGHKDWKKVKDGFPIEIKPTSREDDVDEIDCTWHSFSSWLQSDSPLFWIQGKPGSGKSTLMKFIVENDNTERLLKSRGPNTRILSYFLWKIGKESQNSVKGLLCCLLHDLLIDDWDLVDQTFRQYPFLTSKDYYSEWSSQEAEKVLYSILNCQISSTCLFIDGLDEISDKDGFESILRVLRGLCAIPKVKVCVSSRLETGLIRGIESMGAQKLCLHDLTRPEMAVYLQGQLARFAEEAISADFLHETMSVLLDKAQGVFLWLFLANQSLITGINNGDDEDTLIRRQEELPSELEVLYETMWSRLNANNKVYRETAAMYFHCVLADGWNFGGWESLDKSIYRYDAPTLAQLSMVVKIAEDLIFPPRVNFISCHELKRLCEATEKDLNTRCAGMLQVSEKSVCSGYSPYNRATYMTAEIHPFTRSVQFIHRTAHDFLVDTKPGQDILSHYSGMKSTIDFELKIFKCEVYLWALYRKLEVMAIPHSAINGCIALRRRGADDEIMFELLQTIQDLWNQGVFLLPWTSHLALCYSFPAHLICQEADMADTYLRWMTQPSSLQDYTIALRDICLEWNVSGATTPPTQIIQRLITLGADPHAVGATSTQMELPGNGASFIQEASAFELFLRSTLGCVFYPLDLHVESLLPVLDMMAPTCPDLHRRIIVPVSKPKIGESRVDIPNWDYQLPKSGWVSFEVNMQYLLKRLIAVIEYFKVPTQTYKVHEIANSTVESYTRIRHIVPRGHSDGEDWVNCGRLSCYRIIDQHPFENMCNDVPWKVDILEPGILRLAKSCKDKDSDFDSLAGSYEEVSLADEIEQLASEGLGIHKVIDGKVEDQLDTAVMKS